MLTCYLDDSYADGSSIVTLAGYVATTESWRYFEDSVEELFQEFGVTVFHAVDFKRGTGSFRNWQRERKFDLVGGLFDAASKSNAIGVSVSIRKSVWSEFKKVDRRNSGSSPLGMAFGLTLLRVCEEGRLRSITGKDDCAFVVEQGNKNNADIASIFNKHKRQSTLPNAKSLTFQSKSESRAIQLADFWAYYSRRIALKVVKEGPIRNDADLESYVEPELAGAVRKIWHSVQIANGPVEKISRDHISIGPPTEFFLGPIQ
jgi:Protein of unknown function (DUF3800)